MRRSPRASALLAAAVLTLGLVAGACGGSDDEPGPGTTVTTAAPSSTTTAPTTSSTTDGGATSSTTDGGATSSTTAPPATGGPSSSTTQVGMQPGQPCDLGSHPDCIDPDGIGQGVYLIGGGDCMAAGFPELCVDLDGDGYAGYPDQG